MKKLSVLLAIAALAGLPAAASADNIAVGHQVTIAFGPPGTQFTLPAGHASGNGGLPGGLFILTDNDTGDSFATFCLESNEGIQGQPLVIGSLSDTALNGGINTNAGDPLDFMSAYIYYNYRKGTAGFTDPVAVQEAIWNLEEELPGGAPGYTISGAAQSLITASAGANSYVFGNERVVVLNLYSRQNEPRQDVLGIVPVPEPSVMMLLGTGLLMAGRRLRRK